MWHLNDNVCHGNRRYNRQVCQFLHGFCICGEERGFQKGEEKGPIEERLRNARGLKARGVDTDIIAQVTGLSVDDILSL